MLKYKQLYLKIGNRKIADLIEPKILKDDEFEFPLDSILYWFKISDLIEGPNSQYGYLSKLKLPSVITVPEYIENTLGNFRKKGDININKVIQDLKRGSKGFKYLRPNNINISISNKKVLIFNYGVLNSLYKYQQHPMNVLYKSHNALATCVDDMLDINTGSSKNKFLLLEVPRNLPERLLLEKYSKNINRQSLDNLTTYSHFNIIELWKLLTPELKENSVFNNIPIEEMNNITLLFNLDNKITLLNLGLLLSTISEYPLKSKLAKYKATTIRKVFYIFLNKFINAPAYGFEEVSKINHDDEDIVVDNTVDVSFNGEKDVIEESKIDDVLENDTVDVSKVVVNAIDEITETIDSDTNIDKAIDDKIDILKNNKVISKNQADKLLTIVNKQKTSTINIPGIGNKSVQELTTYSREDFVIDTNENTIPDNKYIKDKDQLTDTIGAYDKTYIKKLLHKDIVSTIYSLNNNDLLVDNLKIEESSDILGSKLNYSMDVITLSGKKMNLAFTLPKIEEDGTYKISGNTYRVRKQKADLPFRKIDYNVVALSTAYGKLFITKAYAKKDDSGFWFKKQLLKKYQEDGSVSDLVMLGNTNVDVKLPIDYSVISRYVKSFKYGKYYFNFNYEFRSKEFNIDEKSLKDIEANNMVIVAKYENKPVLMDMNNKLWLLKDDKYNELDTIYNILEIDRSKEPIEFSSIKIYNKRLPLVLLVMYYYGIDKTLKLLNVKYFKHEPKERVSLNENQYSIVFKDTKLIIDRDYNIGDMLISGLNNISKDLKQVNYKDLNNRNDFTSLFNYMQLPILYVNEFKLLLNMFIDPISKTVLEDMKMPTKFTELLLKSNEVLVDDYYKNPNDITNMMIKGYDRISSMLYKELVNSVKTYENKSVFSNSKITINPYTVLNKISEDSTTVIVDDLNPISELKQSEIVSMIGSGGRMKEAMSRDTRIMHKSEIGIISEASPDSSDVGISAYMTANPKIMNTRGIVELYNKDDSKARTMSTTTLLLPASNKDDVKRSNFANIQASHVVPIKDSKSNPVRTGYESILPYRVSDKFIVHNNIGKGIVTNLTKKYVEITYNSKDGSDVKKYVFKKWTTKEEAGATYTHSLITNLKLKDKIDVGDTILYDSSFFEPDMFNSKRCIFKSSTNMTVALMEDIQTFEDSSAISKKSSTRLATTVTKVKSIIVNDTDIILDMVKPGDKLEPSSVLFSISDASIYKLKGLNKEALEALKRLKQSSPKSKYKGIVNKINIYYNSDLENSDETLKELIKVSNKTLSEDLGKNVTGRVDGTYRIEGNTLQENHVEIKIYIDVEENMGVGDKLIFSNQLKSTIGEVYSYDMYTEDGTEIDTIFGSKSIANRIVNSPYIIGTTAKVLEVLSDKAVELYFE